MCAVSLDELIRQNKSYIQDLHSKRTVEEFVNIIKKVDFQGVTGRINFYNRNSRLSQVKQTPPKITTHPPKTGTLNLQSDMPFYCLILLIPYCFPIVENLQNNPKLKLFNFVKVINVDILIRQRFQGYQLLMLKMEVR